MLKKILLVIALAILACCNIVHAQNGLRKLIIFHSPACHRCLQAQEKLIPEVKQEFKGKIALEYRDTTDIENYKFLLSLKEKYGVNTGMELPLYFFEGNFISHTEPLKERLEELILAKPRAEVSARGLAAVDLIAHFKTFQPLAIISAGLVDGINPCAFTVIVFFVSFLAAQGYRKRELAVVGLSFIFSVFLTYILIGIGVFSVFYQMRAFRVASKALNMSIGIFSILLGFFALYDFFKFIRTKSTEGLILQLPKAVKGRIHSLIGRHYRKTDKDGGDKNIIALVISALITGFVVSILEAVCTGQVYLPTIAFVLKATALKLQALGYLLLYNFMFIVPLLIIFLFALLGVTSGQFSGILKRRLPSIKLLMALLFFGLGVFLLSGCLTQEKKAEDPHLWDFGQVKEGQILKHGFILKNDTQKVLQIKDITTSCGCTVPQVEKKTLLPQESTLLEVKVDTKGYSGPIQQFVYVGTDDIDKPVIRYIIKAVVTK